MQFERELRMISVIVPVYNAQKFIRRCVESVVNQTRRDFELILVDDGSNDGSGDICDGYAKKDSRITVVRQKNSGVSSARNAGLEVATRPYVAFLDSDDEVGDGYLESLLDPPERYDLVVSGYRQISTDSQEIGIVKFDRESFENIDKTAALSCISRGKFNIVWGKRFKRSIIRQNDVKFIRDIDYCEDTLFVLDYLINSRSLLIDESTQYRHRIHQEKRLSDVDATLYDRFSYANNLIKVKLERNFPSVTSSLEWKQRMRGILCDFTFSMLKTKYPYSIKRRFLSKIFKDPDYPNSIYEIRRMFGGEGKLIQGALFSKSPFFVNIVFMGADVKRRFTDKRRR